MFYSTFKYFLIDVELNALYDDLPPEEQAELKKYAKYLRTKSLIDSSNKESSSISEAK